MNEWLKDHLITGVSAKLTGEPERPSGLVARAWTMEIADWMPTPLNQLMKRHHMEAHRLKKKDKWVVGEHARMYGVPQAERKRIVTVLVVLPKGKRAPDPDSLNKSLLDALVDCGCLKNDSHVWVAVEQPRFVRGEELTTFVTLREQ